ncbi:MAG: DUF167 domain-containing protein, partial [Planctomycetota bacterium]
IKVIPHAKKNQVKEESGHLKVYVTAPAQDGKANQALIQVLSEHFKTPKRQIEIIRGEKSRKKIVEII